MKKKRLIGVLKRALVSILVVVLIVFLPSVKLKENDELAKIYSVFLGTKSKYQGIIEIWNIDSFESGKVSKNKLLSTITEKFQAKNKGLYFMVRNLTESECLNLLNRGEYPDLFSCSYGVSEKIKDYVCEFDDIDIDSIEKGAANAVIENGKIMAVPWCRGNYYLISTASHLEKAKILNYNEITLSDVCYSSGYLVSGKKSDKIVYSISFGNLKYLMPLKALKTYNKQEENLVSEYSFNKDKLDISSYSAYTDFIAGNSVVLLGTQRDLFRLKNRENLGKISDVVYEQVSGFNDLIQFVFKAKDSQKEKEKYIQMFAQFLVLEESQKLVAESGLFSILKSFEINENNSTMQNIIPEKFNDYDAPNVFITQNEIKDSQKI